MSTFEQNEFVQNDRPAVAEGDLQGSSVDLVTAEAPLVARAQNKKRKRSSGTVPNVPKPLQLPQVDMSYVPSWRLLPQTLNYYYFNRKK